MDDSRLIKQFLDAKPGQTKKEMVGKRGKLGKSGHRGQGSQSRRK